MRYPTMTIPAGILALALSGATPLLAQGDVVAESVAAGLADLGIEAEEYGGIGADEALQIETVLTGADDDTIKRQRIEAILRGDAGADAPALLGVARLRDSVSAELTGLGLDPALADAMTLGQLAEVENVLASTDPTDTKRLRIEEITNGGGMVEAWNLRQLEASVTEEMAALGLGAEPIAAISIGDLAQIENVMSSTDPDDTKRERIEEILAR